MLIVEILSSMSRISDLHDRVPAGAPMNHDELLDESLATFNRMNRHGAVGITEGIGEEAVSAPSAVEEALRQKAAGLEQALEHFEAGEVAEAFALLEADVAASVNVRVLAGLTENPNLGLWMGDDDDDDDGDDADPGPPKDPVARAESIDLDDVIGLVEAKISLTHRMLKSSAAGPESRFAALIEADEGQSLELYETTRIRRRVSISKTGKATIKRLKRTLQSTKLKSKRYYRRFKKKIARRTKRKERKGMWRKLRKRAAKVAGIRGTRKEDVDISESIELLLNEQAPRVTEPAASTDVSGVDVQAIVPDIDPTSVVPRDNVTTPRQSVVFGVPVMPYFDTLSYSSDIAYKLARMTESAPLATRLEDFSEFCDAFLNEAYSSGECDEAEVHGMAQKAAGIVTQAFREVRAEGIFEAVKSHKAGPYKDPSAAHEKALRLKSKGAKSIRVDKGDGGWMITYASPKSLHEAKRPDSDGDGLPDDLEDNTAKPFTKDSAKKAKEKSDDAKEAKPNKDEKNESLEEAVDAVLDHAMDEAFQSLSSAQLEKRYKAKSSDPKRVAAIRKIAREFNAAKVDGSMLDANSAGVIIQIYDALNPENAKKYAAMKAGAMGQIAWKLAG